ncbi:MAG: hypothetical protein WA952_02365 [Lewinella sp.]
MNKLLILFTLLIMLTPALAQKTIEVPMTPEDWAFNGNDARITTHLGQTALELSDGPFVISRAVTDFQDGTIEYDLALTDSTRFASIYFRPKDLSNYEHVYFRPNPGKGPMANDLIQYAAVVDEVNLWDMSLEYQSNATFTYDGWNHVKLVIRGGQLLAYVNDMDRPALYVPMMDGERAAGEIAFDGEVYVANIRVQPDHTPGLGDGPVYDVTENDPRYLRQWEVTQPATLAPEAMPLPLPVGNEVPALPDDDAGWDPIAAERFGLVNLSRKFGATPFGEQRVVWLRTTITAKEAQLRRLDLGFSDGVLLFLNGGLLGMDRSVYLSPGMTEPEGRLSIDNSHWELPLRAGENELLIAVTNFFYGWGITARLDNGRGLRY